MKTSICSIAIAGLMSGLIGTVQAGVIDPNQSVEGQTQLALSEQWWQWALGIPAASSPLTDTDGSRANLNNNGSVFFLAGSLMGGNVSRTIAVPAGKPLFFPILNNVYVFTPETGEACDGVADPVGCALPWIDMSGATNLHATLNGQNLLTHSSYRQTSLALSTVNLPKDSILGGLDEGDHAFVTDGYWVALEPLPTGSYTLAFGGQSSGTLEVVDLLYVPEPDSLLLTLCALAPLTARWRRASREASA